jgi:hypothetical protein
MEEKNGKKRKKRGQNGWEKYRKERKKEIIGTQSHFSYSEMKVISFVEKCRKKGNEQERKTGKNKNETK